MDILKDVEKQALTEAEGKFLAACEGKTLGDFQKTKEISERSSCVKTALDSFGSPTFIVSCVGMLKSGKSTLVNLFARCDLASPTGYGFDTTLRPALITYSDGEGEIEIWLANDPRQEVTEDVFNKLFNHLRLRGGNGSEDIEEISCHCFPLNKANLNDALCKEARTNNMLPSEPVMVVVKVPRREGALLSSEIMILDTPGLDSGLSVWTKTENKSAAYSWIINNSDLLLFLQSSVAPLNQTAVDILRGISDRNSKMPVWLIQNEMLIKPWLPPKQIEETTERQRKQASEAFNRVMTSYKQINANLGKADTAIFSAEKSLEEKKPELLSESCFLSMEENIRRDLMDVSGIRRGICVDNVLREVRKMKDFVQEYRCGREAEKETIEKAIGEMERFGEQLCDTLLDSGTSSSFPELSVSAIQMQSSMPFKKEVFIQFLTNEAESFGDKESKSGEVKQKILNIKDALIQKMINALQQMRLEDFRLSLQSGENHENNIVKYMKNKFSTFVRKILLLTDLSKETVELYNSCFDEVEFPEMPEKLNVNVYGLDHIHVDVARAHSLLNCVFELQKLSVMEMQAEFSNYYDIKTEDGEFVKLINLCEQKIRENLCAWLNKDVFEKMRDSFIKIFKETIERKNESRRKELAACESDFQTLDIMLTGCEELEKVMRSFYR